MVRRFRRQFAEVSGHTMPGVTRSGGGQVFSQQLREEIGQYAGLHGVEATVQVYSDKLLFSVRPSTVRKFRSLYGEPGADSGAYIQLSESSSTTIDLLHSSLDVLNQHGPSYIQRLGDDTLISFSNICCSSYSVNQPQFLAPHNYQLEKIEPSTSRLNPNIDVKSEPKPEQKQTPKEVKKSTKKPSRGRYVQYSDEMRAKIGKFALKHGNSAAMKHFYAELGHEIPESTIRGMRDKYQLMVERAGPGGVESLGCGPRGRPTSLGSHDSLVQVRDQRIKKINISSEDISGGGEKTGG